MTDHHIQKSQKLLKRLEEEVNSLTSFLNQATSVASDLKVTRIEISFLLYENWKKETKQS